MVAAITSFVSCGIGYYSFAIFLKSLESEFAWNRTALSGAMSLLLVVSGIFAPLVGQWCDTYGSKKVMLYCSVPFGACFILLGFIQTLWHFYAIYFLLALPFAGTFIVPATALITKWFTKKRGLAIALVLCGSNLGALVLAPLMSYLISAQGWRIAYICLGLLAWLVTLPSVGFVMKSDPREIGLSPYGEKVSVEDQYSKRNSAVREQGWTLARVLRTRLFWLVALGFSFVVIGRVGVMTHQVAYFIDMGIEPMAAATALGSTAGIAIAGRLATGYLADKMSKRLLTIISFALEAIGVLILMQTKSMEMVWLYVVIFGIGFGGEPTIRPLLVSELFGSASFGAIFGAMQFSLQIGTAIGPLLAGYIFDTTASYNKAFILFLITYFAAIMAILLARVPKKH